MKEGKENIFNTTLDDLSLLTKSPCSFTLGSCTGAAAWADAAEGFCPSLLPESFLSTAKFCPELPSSAFRAFNLAISSSSCENINMRVFYLKQGDCLLGSPYDHEDNRVLHLIFKKVMQGNLVSIHICYLLSISWLKTMQGSEIRHLSVEASQGMKIHRCV